MPTTNSKGASHTPGGFDDFSIEEERLKALEFSMKRVEASIKKADLLDEKLVRQRYFNTLQDLRNEIRNTMWSRAQVIGAKAEGR